MTELLVGIGTEENIFSLKSHLGKEIREMLYGIRWQNIVTYHTLNIRIHGIYVLFYTAVTIVL